MHMILQIWLATCKLQKEIHWRIQRGARDAPTPHLGPIFFHGNAICRQIWPKIIGWRPTFVLRVALPLGNSISAPGLQNAVCQIKRRCGEFFGTPIQEFRNGKNHRPRNLYYVMLYFLLKEEHCMQSETAVW